LKLCRLTCFPTPL